MSTLAITKICQPRVWAFLCALFATLLLLVWYYLTAQRSPLSTHKNYTRTLVIAKLQQDDTSWVDRIVQEDPYLNGAVYTVDNTSAELTVPMNKGHEAMVYLTYIIDHYFLLNDVTLFMHSYQKTWHNHDFLDSDSALMVQRLNNFPLADYVSYRDWLLQTELEDKLSERVWEYL
ncbi:hypothetical protein VTN77DRAFT_8166 [Rasamsonia byssochlamydoides]|uniref:uncharacterized protein n=1 Tax=Rasamsonia byssochlamydoides TaxID=89139 RepID=UPI003742AF20